MISNDKEFEEVFKRYLKSKGTEGNETYFCGCLSCDDCTLKDVSYGLSDIGVALCSRKPFEKIKKYEKKIELLKQEIEIMNKWEKEDILRKKLLGVCMEIRSDWGNLLCSGIKCDNCIFNGKTNNLYKWMEEQKRCGEQE